MIISGDVGSYSSLSSPSSILSLIPTYPPQQKKFYINIKLFMIPQETSPPAAIWTSLNLAKMVDLNKETASPTISPTLLPLVGAAVSSPSCPKVLSPQHVTPELVNCAQTCIRPLAMSTTPSTSSAETKEM